MAEQYDLSGGFETREALETAMAGEAYTWY